MNSDLPVPIHIQSHQLSFQKCSSLHVIEKLPTMSTVNLKQHINLYFNLDSLPVTTFDNLTWPPPLLLPFSPIAAPANTWVSLRLQLMKATVLAESSLYFIFSLGSLCSSHVYRHESGRCCTLPFFLTRLLKVKILKSLQLLFFGKSYLVFMIPDFCTCCLHVVFHYDLNAVFGFTYQGTAF